MEKLEQGLEKIGFLEYTELPLIKKASAKTKVPAPVIVLVLLLVFVGLLCTPYFSELLSTLIMFTIPAFETFRAIKSKSEKDDEELLTYWIVFGSLYTFDSVFRYLLDFLGWYSIIRLVILMFIFYSRTYGSKLIYARAIRPFFEKFGECIEKMMQPLEEQGRRISRYIQVQQDEFKKLSNLKESMEDTKEKTE
jgi:hypothetical protein